MAALLIGRVRTELMRMVMGALQIDRAKVSLLFDVFRRRIEGNNPWTDSSTRGVAL